MDERESAPGSAAKTAGLARQLRTGLRAGVGLALACGASVILVYIVRGIDPYSPSFTSLPALLAALLSSGIVGGVVYGLLARWRSTIVGRFGLGAVIMLAVSACVALFSNGSNAGATDEWRALGMFMALGGVIGVVWLRPTRQRP